MSWKLREGVEHNFIEGALHVHNIHLYNAVTGGEHNLHILLGAPTCRECKRPFAQDDLGHLDPATEINNALETLMANHNAVMEYAKRTGAPVRIGPLASHVPQGHKIVTHPFGKMLHLKRDGER